MAKHDQILTEVGILCTAEKQQHIGIVENLCQFFYYSLKSLVDLSPAPAKLRPYSTIEIRLLFLYPRYLFPREVLKIAENDLLTCSVRAVNDRQAVV